MPDPTPAAERTGARRPLISGNWKMNLNHWETVATLDKLRYLLTSSDLAQVDVSVHPPFTDIRSAQTFLESEKTDIALGRPELPLGGEGRLHRRGLAGVPGQVERALRDRGPLRAP